MLGFIEILLVNMSQSGRLSSPIPALLLSMLQLWAWALRFSGVGLTVLPVIGRGTSGLLLWRAGGLLLQGHSNSVRHLPPGVQEV